MIVIDGQEITMPPKNIRYRFPSLRIRGTATYKVSEHFGAGIMTDLNMRYLERAGSLQYRNTVSIPVLFVSQYDLIESNKINLGFQAGIGYNFMRIQSGRWSEKGGLNYMCGLSLTKKRSGNKNRSYLLGYEQQIDRISFPFPKRGSDTEYINARHKQFRNQLYASLRFDF